MPDRSPPEDVLADPAVGLTGAEVAERVAAGQVNRTEVATARPLRRIVRDNVLTFFNGLIVALSAVVLLAGSPKNAVFGGVAVLNALIGTVQEWRAARVLDRLAVLDAADVGVVRDGVETRVPVGDVVLDDVVVLALGDQIVADGVTLVADGLTVDESLLTGESDPVVKHPGDRLLSGSHVTAGSGRQQATRVGADAYANQVAAEARTFTLVHSELREGLDRILRIITVALVPIGLVFLAGQLWRAGLSPREAAITTVGGLVAMVPAGLVLLTSVALAVAVVRLGNRQILVRELAAVEGMARVDVVCLDKTGTLTAGVMELVDVEPVGGGDLATARTALAAMAAAEAHPNATLAAIAAALPAPTAAVDVVAAVPFSSSRGWSAVAVPGTTWVLGGPDVVLGDGGDGGLAAGAAAVRARADELAATGQRVVLLARTGAPLDGERRPAPVEPVALVVLAEQLREDAAETLAFLAAQHLDIKVISGDNPRTVTGVARRVGLAVEGEGTDGRTLPADPEGLAAALDEGVVFGRVQPDQKQALVKALQSRGHEVAMTGDGVNDVLALKTADIGVAMGSGAAATRAVAQLVLLDGRYTSLPLALAEGRRVIANIERVAVLFLMKNVYAAVLAMAVTVVGVSYPFVPLHVTVVDFLTIGVPSFFLSLAPSNERAHPGFVGRVLRRAVPTGLVTGATILAAYLLARATAATDAEADTTAVIALFTVGFTVVWLTARPMTPGRWILLGSVIGAAVLVFAIPPVRDFFGFDLPGSAEGYAPLLVVAPAIAVLDLLARREARRPDDPPRRH